MTMVLDSTHFKLKDLENMVLSDMSHIHRLKPATLSTPCYYISTPKQLTEAVGLNHLPIESK